MSRHGSRSISIIDFDGTNFFDGDGGVQRWLCSACGSSSSSFDPELESGFKISKNAADQLVSLAVENGISATAAVCGIDKSSVSRLISARTDQYLKDHPRPPSAFITAPADSLVAVVDAALAHPAAYFASSDMPKLAAWLAEPKPALLIPDIKMFPAFLPWQSKFDLAISRSTYGSLVRPLVHQAAKRMVCMMNLKPSLEERCAHLLAKPFEELTATDVETLDSLVPAGTPCRHFIRLKEQVLQVYEVDYCEIGRARLSKFLSACRDNWSEIFKPVLKFLSAFDGMLLRHQLALTPEPSPKHKMAGPANLLTLSLSYRSQTAAPSFNMKAPR